MEVQRGQSSQSTKIRSECDQMTRTGRQVGAAAGCTRSEEASKVFLLEASGNVSFNEDLVTINNMSTLNLLRRRPFGASHFRLIYCNHPVKYFFLYSYTCCSSLQPIAAKTQLHRAGFATEGNLRSPTWQTPADPHSELMIPLALLPSNKAHITC